MLLLGWQAGRVQRCWYLTLSRGRPVEGAAAQSDSLTRSPFWHGAYAI